MNLYRVMQALDLILNSPFGEAYSFTEDEHGQDELINKGVWYAQYLLTPFGFLDDGPRLALGIMPPGPLGTWPVWLVHSNASIQVVSLSIAELIPGLLVELALDNTSFWDDLQRRWREWREVLLEAHQLLGGDEHLFQRVETALLANAETPDRQLRLLAARTADAAYGEAVRGLGQLQTGEEQPEAWLPSSSVWASTVNSRLLAAWNRQGKESAAFVSNTLQLLRLPNAVGMADSSELTGALNARSAWFGLMVTLRAWRHQHAAWFAGSVYEELIEPMAEWGYDGVRHFELAAWEETQQGDATAAYAHLTSASFWSYSSRGILLPEAHQMACFLAEKYEWADVLTLLKD